MPAASTDQRFSNGFLIAFVVAISAAFLAMVWTFALTILMAAIFAGLSYPSFRRLQTMMGGRSSLAAVTTLVLLMVLVLAPLLVVLAAGANEALRITQTVGPRLQQFVDEPSSFQGRLRGMPFYAYIAPYRQEILTKTAELVGGTSKFLFSALSATTVATAVFIFQFAVFLYTLFFCLIDGPLLLRGILGYLPLAEIDKARMLDKFVSVTRATLKGTILIGAAQGLMGGIAFWAVGIDGPVFWGTVMTVLSIIPGVGGALVWVPAAIILALTGDVWPAVGLALFCALIVGSVDNLLRPRLVGRDTQMHELMIFFSTLGGLSLFGATGFIVGPLLAGLFLTAWEMFGVAFRQEIDQSSSAIVGPDMRRPDQGA
jgi:predicted PurR-regulated permease PerM